MHWLSFLKTAWFIYGLDLALLFFIGTFIGFIRKVRRAIRETNAVRAEMQGWLAMFKTPFQAVYLMKNGQCLPPMEAGPGRHFISYRVAEGLVVELIDERAAN